MLVLILLALSGSAQASDSSYTLTDAQAGYDQAKYDACVDSDAEDSVCDAIVEAGI